MKRHTIAIILGSAALVGASVLVQAQTVYRIVGADGKVTFSDKPPVSGDQGKVSGVGVGAAGAALAGSLPFEVRQIASKYPVTLYTGQDCAPCSAGRSLLTGRGIPFSERTVTTSEDATAFQRLTGENSLPVLTVGGQRIRGYADVEWTQYLDAAGYPKSSVLPASYRNAAPTPLVALQAPIEPKPTPKAAPVDVLPAPVTTGPTPSNPAGIAF